MNELQEFFKQFASISDADFQLLLPYVKKKQLKASQYFLQNNDIANSIAFIVSGSMRAYYTKDDGLEINILLRTNGEFIADYESFLLNEKAKYSIQAIEDSVLICLSREGLFKISSQSFFWNQVARKMAEMNYISAKRRAEDLLFLTPKQRYDKMLKEHPYMLQKFPLKHISAYLGIRQQSLSRIRSRKE